MSTTDKALYVAGPMRGIPHNNTSAFLYTAAVLRNLGYQVKCPAEQEAGFDPADVRPALAFVLSWIARHCAAVVLLPGWETSRGTLAEMATAWAVDIPVFERQPFLDDQFDAPQITRTGALQRLITPDVTAAAGPARPHASDVTHE